MCFGSTTMNLHLFNCILVIFFHQVHILFSIQLVTVPNIHIQSETYTAMHLDACLCQSSVVVGEVACIMALLSALLWHVAGSLSVTCVYSCIYIRCAFVLTFSSLIMFQCTLGTCIYISLTHVHRHRDSPTIYIFCHHFTFYLVMSYIVFICMHVHACSIVTVNCLLCYSMHSCMCCRLQWEACTNVFTETKFC